MSKDPITIGPVLWFIRPNLNAYTLNQLMIIGLTSDGGQPQDVKVSYDIDCLGN